jgi:large subunit ribosomal protein L28
LHVKRFFIPETGEWITLKVSAAAIRTISKLGIYTYIKKLEKKGDIIFNSEPGC